MLIFIFFSCLIVQGVFSLLFYIVVFILNILGLIIWIDFLVFIFIVVELVELVLVVLFVEFCMVILLICCIVVNGNEFVNSSESVSIGVSSVCIFIFFNDGVCSNGLFLNVEGGIWIYMSLFLVVFEIVVFVILLFWY